METLVSTDVSTTYASSSAYVARVEKKGSSTGVGTLSRVPLTVTAGKTSFAPAPQAVNLSSISLSLAGRIETFLLEIEDGFVYLRHPRWSWVGVGGTPSAAVSDLLEEIQRLAVVMSDMSPDEFTPDGLEFRHFALSFL